MSIDIIESIGFKLMGINRKSITNKNNYDVYCKRLDEYKILKGKKELINYLMEF